MDAAGLYTENFFLPELVEGCGATRMHQRGSVVAVMSAKLSLTSVVGGAHLTTLQTALQLELFVLFRCMKAECRQDLPNI